MIANLPTPTLVTIAIEFLGINFAVEFCNPSSEINFCGITPNSLSFWISEDWIHGIAPPQKVGSFVLGVPPVL